MFEPRAAKRTLGRLLDSPPATALRLLALLAAPLVAIAIAAQMVAASDRSREAALALVPANPKANDPPPRRVRSAAVHAEHVAPH
ncbi:MAG: hypothetical protein HS128_04590 [Ideonella sp.]|nr:hypothetical protein [Ideonella sp.]MCC7455475.1 hypothetical protein [Nitrospira sp.]